MLGMWWRDKSICSSLIIWVPVPETDREANKPVQVYNLRVYTNDEKWMQQNHLQAWVPLQTGVHGQQQTWKALPQSQRWEWLTAEVVLWLSHECKSAGFVPSYIQTHTQHNAIYVHTKVNK